jgi:hypothetical protein
LELPLFPLPPQQIRSGKVPHQKGRILFKKTRKHPIGIRQRLVMRPQQQIEDRIAFLEQQLESLEHFLPETYQYLMEEMDCQQRELMQLKIQEFYRSQS